MKKQIIILKIFTVLLLLQSCKKYNPGPPTPECEWNSTNYVTFYNLQLNYPPGISDFHKNRIPLDNIDRSLLNALQTYEFQHNLSSKITVDIKKGKTNCKSENKIYGYKRDSPKITHNKIEIPYISNAVFQGEVVATISSNSFVDHTGAGSLYYIKWTSSGNNPNGGMQENLIGKKIPYSKKSGRTTIHRKYYIRRGQRHAL